MFKMPNNSSKIKLSPMKNALSLFYLRLYFRADIFFFHIGNNVSHVFLISCQQAVNSSNATGYNNQHIREK